MGHPHTGVDVSRGSWLALLWAAAMIVGFAIAHACVAQARPARAGVVVTPTILESEKRNQLVVTHENSARCVACHSFEHTLSHPIQVTPALATPASLPLLDGQVACVTCHDASPEHRSAEIPVGQRIEGSGLCVSCHQGTPHSARSIHAMSMRKAHLRGDSSGVRGVLEGAIDRESQGCMDCHDGAVASDAGAHMPGLNDREKAEHPIGVAMRLGEKSRERDFKMARHVDHRIRLFEGMVGCGSCHSPYSREPAQLVINNRDSALCLSCHTQ